ncbi:MAG: Uncharacterized protein CI949_4114, partial [Halanaerobium sp.]
MIELIYKILEYIFSLAKIQITSEGFVVLKGSRMSNNTVDSAQNWVIKKR